MNRSGIASAGMLYLQGFIEQDCDRTHARTVSHGRHILHLIQIVGVARSPICFGRLR